LTVGSKLREALLRNAAMWAVLLLGILIAVLLNSLWVLVAAVVASILAPYVVRLWSRRR
jgi:hypothetical protein